ncbi:hypothetical protein V8F06_005764 [Rhypophila decipiens]
MKTTTSKKSSQDKSARHSKRSQARVIKNKAKTKQTTAAPAPVGTTVGKVKSLVEKVDTLKRRIRCLEANVSDRLEDVSMSVNRLANLIQEVIERAAPVQQGQESTPATAAPEPPSTLPAHIEGMTAETAERAISIPATPESLNDLYPHTGTYEPDEPIPGDFFPVWGLYDSPSPGTFRESSQTTTTTTTPELSNTNEQQHNDTNQDYYQYNTNTVETPQYPVPVPGRTLVPIIPQTDTVRALELCWALAEVINSITHDTWYFDSDQVIAEYCAERLNHLWNKEFDNWLPVFGWLRKSLRYSGFLEEDDMWTEDNRPCVLSMEDLGGLYLCYCGECEFVRG